MAWLEQPVVQERLLLQKWEGEKQKGWLSGYGWRGRTLQQEGLEDKCHQETTHLSQATKRHTQQEGKDYFCQQLLRRRLAIGLELSIGQTFYDICIFHPGNKTWQFLHVPVCVSFDSGDRSVQSRESSHSSTSSSWTCFLKRDLGKPGTSREPRLPAKQ